eukprot:gb/GECG01009003.1/.p1 GENE.gb/GECG01009003.1/~~gb/GECG01009003.1/.p1  ORF type:complete len:839 (+),score=58.98 gb/GECG01009003.1/:1-2517(+)
MLGILWWIGTMCAAFAALTGKLYPRFTLTEILFASIPVGTIGGAWATYLVSCLLNEISKLSLTLSTILILGVTWEFLPAFRKQAPILLHNAIAEAKSQWMLWLNIIVWGYFVVPLFQTRFIPEDEKGNVYSGGSCWSDLSIHLHMAYSFIYGRNQDVSFFDLSSPIFAGAKMSYPFLPDWHAAVLYWMGSSMRHAMMDPGIAMFFSLVGLLFLLGKRLVRTDFASTVGIMLTILAGGMGAISLLKVFPYEKVIYEMDPMQDHADGKMGVLWFAFLPHVYLPQRGATFAYPMVLTILLIMWTVIAPSKHFFKKNTMSLNASPITNSERSSLLMMAGIFAASLPMVQAHSFISLGIIIGLLFVIEAPSWLAHPLQILGWISAGVVTLFLSLPQLSSFVRTALYGGPDGEGTFMSFRPIWSHTNTIEPTFLNFWWFWWNSLGPAIYLFTGALIWWSVPLYRVAKSVLHLKVKGGKKHTASCNGAQSPILDDSSEDSEGGSSTASEKREIYQYGGKRKLKGDEDDGLLEIMQEFSQRYAPVQKFALQVEQAIQEHNQGRLVDSAKFAFCGAVLWMFANLVILQPWDRDNCKVLYVALFIMSPFSAKMLTFPFEHLYALHRGTYKDIAISHAKRDDDAHTNGVQNGTSGLVEPELGVPALGSLKSKSKMWILAGVGAFAVPVLLYYATFSGIMSIRHEYTSFHVMYDQEGQDIGEFMRHNIPARGVTLHDDTHLSPAGYYAGRQVLVSYTGWVSSHGYDFHDRNRDREFILPNLMKDSDPEVYSALRRWGVRYVLSERPREHPRDTQKEGFDPDLYLDGQLKRLHQAGRYHLFEVLGYGFPPQ